MIRIIEASNYSLDAIDLYQKIGPVQFGLQEGIDLQTIIIVIRIGHYINSSFLDRYPSLKYIISPTTGITHLDVDEIERHRIHLRCLRDVPDKILQIKSTSEMTLGMAILINRKLGKLVANLVSDSAFHSRLEYCGNELSVNSLGIIGYGRIGRHLYDYCQRIWGTSLVWDIDQNRLDDLPLKSRAKNLDELLKNSKTICLCVDLNQTSLHMIGENELASMPRGACLINTSRGEVVDESAIEAAIKSGHLGGYATDVLSNEDFANISSNRLWKLAMQGHNVLITSHRWLYNRCYAFYRGHYG